MHGNDTRKLPCSYLYLKLAKASFLSFIFFFYKIREQKGTTGLEGTVPVGGERWWGKG
jgi:hypothetical protein